MNKVIRVSDLLDAISLKHLRGSTRRNLGAAGIESLLRLSANRDEVGFLRLESLRRVAGIGDVATAEIFDLVLSSIADLATSDAIDVAPPVSPDVELAIPILCAILQKAEGDIGGHSQTSLYAEIALEFIRALKLRSQGSTT